MKSGYLMDFKNSMFCKNKEKKELKRKRGFAISMEMLLVVGVLMGVIFYVVSNISASNDKIKVTTAAAAITQIATDTQKLFRRSTSGFDNVTAAALSQNRIPPVEMTDGTDIFDQWGSKIVVSPVKTTTGSAHADAVSFAYTAVDQEVCSAFVNAAEGSFYKILIGTAVVKELTAGTPYTPVGVGTECMKAARSSITFFVARG